MDKKLTKSQQAILDLMSRDSLRLSYDSVAACSWLQDRQGKKIKAVQFRMFLAILPFLTGSQSKLYNSITYYTVTK